jgi:hypothetical protein
MHEMLTLYNIHKTLLAFIICLNLFTTLHAQIAKQDNDILYWTQKYRLAFSDFHGKAPKRDTTLADASATTLTHRLGSVLTGINVHYESKGGKVAFTIQAALKKASSWIRNYGDTITLKHEQGHFDLCEVYARTLRRDIQRATSLSGAEAIYKRVSAAEEQEQDCYDKENTFRSGGITPFWREKIATRLKELEAFKNPVVMLAIRE